MFIKLTKFDNSPIWVNASFIVTVEPRREGSGSVVVPIGDGLDYDVRESPEAVLAMLEGAPIPAVVPVPVSDCLTQTPEDVSPDPEPVCEEPVKEEDEQKPRKRATRAKTKAAASKKTKPDEEPPVAAAPVEFSDDQVSRLRKLAPKSVGKLRNTLLSQFKVSDADAAIKSLADKGALTLDGARVIWNGTTDVLAQPAEPQIADW